MKFGHSAVIAPIHTGTNVHLAFKVSKNKENPRKWIRLLKEKISNGFSIYKVHFLAMWRNN